MHLREVRNDDLPILADFLQEGFPSVSHANWLKRFDMWWLQNPAQRADIPFGWVLEDPGEGIIGFFGNIPVKFLVRGKEGIAFASSSWYVRPSARGGGLYLRNAYLHQKNGNIFLDTTPTRYVESILARMGYSSVPLPFNALEYQYIRDYRGKVIGTLVRRFRHPLVMQGAEMVMLPLRMLSRASERFREKKNQDHKNPGYHCSLCTHCDERFTALWKAHEPEAGTALCRDAETLNWLFFSALFDGNRYVVSCTRTADESLAGYMVFDLFAFGGADVRKLRLLDMYVPDNDEEAIRALVQYSKVLAKSLDAATVAYYSQTEAIDRVLAKEFSFRRRVTWPYYYKFAGDGAGGPVSASYIDPNRGVLGLKLADQTGL